MTDQVSCHIHEKFPWNSVGRILGTPLLIGCCWDLKKTVGSISSFSWVSHKPTFLFGGPRFVVYHYDTSIAHSFNPGFSRMLYRCVPRNFQVSKRFLFVGGCYTQIHCIHEVFGLLETSMRATTVVVFAILDPIVALRGTSSKNLLLDPSKLWDCRVYFGEYLRWIWAKAKDSNRLGDGIISMAFKLNPIWKYQGGSMRLCLKSPYF